MDALLGFAVILALIIGSHWLTYQLGEWKEAFGRWRHGEPLWKSDAIRLRHQEIQAQLHEERQRMRDAYETRLGHILDKSFRKKFIELGIDQQIRAEVIDRGGDVCAACGCKITRKYDRHIDHIMPMKHHPQLEFYRANLQVLCRSCNAHKSAYDGWDWREVVAARRKTKHAPKHKRKAGEARKKSGIG
jgi:5-methylcytosine-specific restriction endonuclease McrA